MLQIYDALMAPLERGGLAGLRNSLLSKAEGRVLEVGFGTGENLRHYPQDGVVSLSLLDQETPFLDRKKAVSGLPEPEVISGDLAKLPFEDEVFDTVVVTLVLCSVQNPLGGIAELHRVLKPGGQLLFLEHIRSHSLPLRALQSLATPLWKRLAGNCHLDRPTVEYLRQGGFQLEELEYRLGKIVSFGLARKIAG
jgi:ubiquinone/menaquinone biosynthesis C-methylase UbiE